MDPLSIAGTIASFIQLAGGAITYVNDFINEPKERQTLLQRCKRLEQDLQNIEIKINQARGVEKEASRGPFGRKLQNDRLFKRYKEAIKKDGRFAALTDRLEKLFDGEFKKQVSRRREIGRRFVWTWKKDNLKIQFDEVIALAEDLRDFLQDDDAQLGHETWAGVWRLQRTNEENQIIEILNWVAPPGEDVADIVGSYSAYTSTVPDPFTTSSATYRQWVSDAESKHWHLNCYGKPGSGKSYRARAAISDLSTRFRSLNVPVLFIRFNHMNGSRQTLTAFYRRLLRQLLSQSTDNTISDEIRRLWNERRLDGYGGPDEFEAKKLLVEELQKYPKKFIVVDALDEAGECANSIHSEISSLRKVAGCCILSTTRQSPRGEKYEVIGCNGCGKYTGDLYWQCTLCIGSLGRKFDLCRQCYQDEHRKCNDSSHTMEIPSKVNIEVSPTVHEIQGFVTTSINQELSLDDTGDDDPTMFEGFTPNLKRIQGELGNSRWDLIPEQIANAAGDSYLVADLIIRRLKAQVSIEGALKVCDGLQNGNTSDYDEQYSDMLALCVNSGAKEGRKVAYDHLALMACTRTILSFKQLSHAVAVRHGDESVDDFSGRCCSKQTVRKETRGLLSIGEFGDPEDFAVTFFHQTLKTYLEEQGKSWFRDSHQKMFNACCAYLQLDAFKEPFADPKALDKTLKELPFASYAAIFWGEHLRQISSLKDNIVPVLELFNEPNRKKALTQIARHVFTRAELAWDVPGDVGPLHICAFQGLAGMCRILIDDGEDVDSGEETHGQTPLHYACRRGHSDVAKILLNAHADPNIASGTGKTPLMEAIENDQMEIFDFLLEHASVDVNTDGGPPMRMTALHLAAKSGKNEFVKRLLQHRKILVNKSNTHNITPLTCAVRCPSHKCVEILLQRSDIDLTIRDNRVGTAMDNIANMYPPEAHDEIERVAELFVQHPSTPLLGAGMQYLIEQRRDHLVQLFLDAKSYVGWRDDHGRSLLHIAAGSGNGEALRLVEDHLLDALALQIGTIDNYGRTPLHAACFNFFKDNGHAAWSLLEKGAQPLVLDSDGQTPLNVAYRSAHFSQRDTVSGLFQQFLPQGSHQASQPQEVSLETTVKFGNVDQLQSKIQNLPHPITLVKDPYTGWTALHIAICESFQPRVEMLKLLLPNTMPYLDSGDNVGQTCLHKAAIRGSPECLELLIDAGADLDIKDKWGDTAFDLAQRNQDKSSSFILINAGAKIDKSSVNNDFIHYAVDAADVGVVKRLIEVGVDIHFRQRGNGPTPLTLAKDQLRAEVYGNENNLLQPDQWRNFQDIGSLLKTARESPEAKALQRIIDYLEEEEAQRQRRPSTFVHRDLTPLIHRLRQDDERQSRRSLAPPQKQTPGMSPPPSYDRVVDNDNIAFSRASSLKVGEGLGIFSAHDEKPTLITSLVSTSGERERIVLIVVGGIVAVAWMWLALHYLSSSPRVIHEL